MSGIIIVGAGLGGIMAARELLRAGRQCLLLDAADRPGGRLKTDHVSGFGLDRGFQVAFTAYPTLAEVVSWRDLQPRRFEPGALIWDGQQLREIHARKPLVSALSPLFGLADKWRVRRWSAQCRRASLDEIAGWPDLAAEEHLRALGFSEPFLDRFARPFFGGIFLDHELQVSVRQLAFVWKMLEAGDTVLPAEGIEAIPRALAGSLPSATFRGESTVVELVRDGGRVVGVRLESGETLHAQAVIVATPAPEAARLTGSRLISGAKSSTCVYFESDDPPVDRPILVLNGTKKGVVNEFVPVSVVSPSLAPPGRHLVSATVLGENVGDDLPKRVQAEGKEWFGPRASSWRHLRTYQVRYAQMPQPAGFMEQRPAVEAAPGLYFGGEFLEHSSIEGALRAGRRAAREVLAR